MDWSLGRYESTAAQLLPAAEVVVAAAAPARGEHVVDVGCGTGNAALLAARAGARATGVDPAQRLLDVAAAQARREGIEASFVRGEAAALPLEDGAADVLLSVFGVIFAPDASAAAAEMARVSASGARIVLSAWLPEGAISDAVRVSREAIAAAVGAPEGPPPFAWHDAAALSGLLAPHGFEVAVEEHRHAFTGESPSAYLDAEGESHPLAVAGRAVLEPRGEAEAVRARMLEIYEAANEDADAFKVTSRYIVATARRAS
jgi:SAM-dependent methyltransferase